MCTREYVCPRESEKEGEEREALSKNYYKTSPSIFRVLFRIRTKKKRIQHCLQFWRNLRSKTVQITISHKIFGLCLVAMNACLNSSFNLHLIPFHSSIHPHNTPFCPPGIRNVCNMYVCIFRRFFSFLFCHISAALKYDYSDKQREVAKKAVSICNATQRIFYVFHCVCTTLCLYYCVCARYAICSWTIFGRSLPKHNTTTWTLRTVYKFSPENVFTLTWYSITYGE